MPRCGGGRRRWLAFACDITDPAAVRATFESVDRVDVLVNGAGLDDQIPLAQITPDDMQRVYEVNVAADGHQSRDPAYARDARIINIGSRAYPRAPPITPTMSTQRPRSSG